ncbi:hypothetical protein TW86_04185 [Halomonas sp. S2151]|uniref:tyrosine-type recombinase/integrase n=1 Tax=Halomonas sp. S2151 TaxID=579478 RepID=UPI0005FA0C6D|nr:tyrosine-type recombinase/integrase [Halomonas sp. S2151]KJZ17456.1 hypothetical protein TW86_04185 [Halomonas sp. S2151]
MADAKGSKSLTKRITKTALMDAKRRGFQRVYDTEVRGFYCQFKQDGGGSLRFRYRSKATGERPTVKIGDFPGIDVDEARELASKWRLQLRDGIEPRIEESRRRDEEKRRRERERLSELQIIGTFVERVWKPHIMRNKRGHHDLQRIERHFKHWYDRRIPDITKRDVTTWQHKWEKEGLAHATIKRSFDTFKSMLNYAVDQEVIEVSPLNRVSLKRPPASQVTPKDGEGPMASRRPLTDYEVKGLFHGLELYTEEKKEQRRHSLTKKAKQHLPDLTHRTYVDHAVPAILCCYYGGFRPGDVLGLQWEHLDGEVKAITKVIEKIAHHGHGLMHFPLADALTDVLRVWWEEQGRPTSGYVFPSPVFPGENKRLSEGALRKPWARIKKLGGLQESLHLYTLRHNFASQLIMAGESLETVRVLMGHTDIQTTISNYSHLTNDHKERAMSALSKILGAPDLKKSHLKVVK